MWHGLRVTNVLLLTLVLGWIEAQAQFPAGAFWKRRAYQIKFSTSAQTILAGNCSGVTTVAHYNANNVLTNVASNLTVNLSSGSGSTTFYSDLNCVTPITSITIASGTSSSSFYFVNTAVQSITLTASATNYSNVAQNETINTNGFVWTGGGANANWNTAANWSGGVAPTTTSQYALFDSTCVSNCSPNITANMTIGGVRMVSGYNGTITQGTGFTMTVGGAGGWSQQSGTFVGSNAAVTITGGMTVSGGSYTFSSGLTTVNGGGYVVLNSPTLDQSLGTLKIGGSGTYNVTPGTYHYNNIEFGGNGPVITLNGTMYVDGPLAFSATNTTGQIKTGTIVATDNITVTNNGTKGNAIVQVAGNVAGQTVTSVAGGFIPSLRIEAGTRNVTLSGTVQPCTEYTVTSVGTLTTTGSTLYFDSYCPASITVGSEHYNNVTFRGWGDTYNLNSSTMYVDGTLTFASPYASFAYVDSGTIVTTGDITTVDYGNKGTAVVKLVGNVAGQTITGLAAAYIPSIRIEAGTRNVTLSGTVRPLNEYTVVSVGTLTTTGSTLHIDRANASVTVGSEHYNNVTFSGWANTYNLNNSTLYVDGTLTFSGGTPSPYTAINSGTIIAAGSISSSSYGASGSVAIQMTGNTAATITQASSTAKIPANLTIAKTGSTTVSLASAGYLNLTGQSLNVTGGNVNMAGYALTIASGLTLNGRTITKGGGVLTVNGTVVGTGSLYGGTVAP